MTWLGLAMFALALAGIALSGLPAFVVLIGVALAAGAVGVAAGGLDLRLAQALPLRLVGLLEHDLLQALALYALVGALLHRLNLAEVWLRTVARWLRPSGAGSALAGLGLGALTAPMNGSVGASLGLLSRTVAPRLRADGLPPAPGVAVVAVASTLGVIVPPSLVLLLLGDAMMRAHTEALRASGVVMQVVNNQDVVRAVLAPGALVLVWCLGWTAWAGLARGRRARRDPAAQVASPVAPSAAPVSLSDATLTLTLSAAVAGMLAAVASGRLYAVEAAAAAGMALLAWGLLSGQLRGQWRAVLDEAMGLTGMVFGLLVGATTFTLVLRGLGTDAWLSSLLHQAQVGPTAALLGVLALLLACAFVLDAFELIFLVVPIVMPPLLTVVPDAAWVSALTLLVLQIGYLLPPLGYAVLMARAAEPTRVSAAALLRALAPYLLGMAAVLGAVLTWPQLTHPVAAPAAAAQPAAAQDLDELLRQQARPREAATR